MSFRIDLIDPLFSDKTGQFPIASVTTLTRQQALDRIGTWSFSFERSDPALREIEGKDFHVFWRSDGQQTYDLGIASYLNHKVGASGGVSVNATGTLRDLQRQTVLQRSFDGATATVNSVLAEIVPIRQGWALGEVDTLTQSAPMDFWYETILDSVTLLATTFGQHFREGSAPRTLDFGAFGVISGVMAVGGERELPPEAYTNPDVCHIAEIEVTYESDVIVNKLIPFGGAVGVATISLASTTVTQPGYPLQFNTLPDGSLYFYIADFDSVFKYGLTEARFVRSDLRPIVNTPEATEFAANVLYEAALASLLNLKDRQTIYTVSVVGLRPGRVRPGDKIRARFRGVAETPVGEQLWIDIDDDFFVLEINETFGAGVATRLVINLNAIAAETVEDLLASTIQQFENSQIHVQPTISRYTVGPYTKRVSASPAVAADFSFQLGLETLDVWYVKINIAGEPLKSSIQNIVGQSTTTPTGGGSTTPSGGGGTTPSGGGGTTPGTSGTHLHNLPGGSQTGTTGSLHTHLLSDHVHTVPSHEHSTPDHSHTFTPNISTTYGLFTDTVSPVTGNIYVNNAIVAAGVGLADYELDITSYILAAANLQQEHTIRVECIDGRGEIQFQAQVLAVIQGIAVS